MRLLRRVSEAEVIAEFLKNEFYQEEFDHDRERFERLVVSPDLADGQENALRRALLFRRRGHLLRELPPDTEWWEIELDPADLDRVRVFPRAQWRRISDGSFALHDVVEHIRANRLSGVPPSVLNKIHMLRYRMRAETPPSTVLLIGTGPEQPLTILEGNHRLAAATLVSPEAVNRRLRVVCGFSPRMTESCWYHTSFSNLWRYLKNRLRNIYDRDADVGRVLAENGHAAHPLPAYAKSLREGNMQQSK